MANLANKLFDKSSVAIMLVLAVASTLTLASSVLTVVNQWAKGAPSVSATQQSYNTLA